MYRVKASKKNPRSSQSLQGRATKRFFGLICIQSTTFMLQDGAANYLKGLMLILCYLIVAASFFVHVDPQSSDG